MVRLMISVKKCPGTFGEIGIFLEEGDAGTERENAVANAIYEGVKIVVGEMRAMGEIVKTMELEDPNTELAERIKAKFRRKGEA